MLAKDVLCLAASAHVCQWKKIGRKTRRRWAEWTGLEINEAVRITEDKH